MMERRLTTNSLFHDDEEAKKEREKIYVPLALVERKKTDKRKEEEEYSPDRGSQLYQPEYEEKQRFEHSAFLQQILQQGQGKTQGRRIALIGEPGAGKTTLLQKIADWIEEQKLGLPLWVSLADLAPGGSLQDFDSYLLKRWLPRAVSEDRVERDFKRQFEEQRVWLLLDGVDEVATSGVETLGSIAKQLVGWVGKARVVLTCRLNVWQADANALSDFETFRLLDFDYPQQVHRFIDNWFAIDSARGKRLQAELDKAQRSRIRDLVKNPLRLALLCRTWQLYEGDLPDTRAGLYAQFVERFYDWKSHRFPISKQRQRDLNRALGELALVDIDSPGGRFRLREDFVCEKLGDADDESSLCYVALQLGWLNQVGVAAESPDEKVYAFYHATFEEYFAALAVSDWRYFLNHLPENVASGTYRVFESQWKQVILLWLGRKDLDEARKEEFISALVDLDDKTGRDFYGFRTLFLAAAGIAEFKECSRAHEIVAQVVKVGFGFFSEEQQEWLMWPDEVEWAARAALRETERGRAIAAFVEIICNSQVIRKQAARSFNIMDGSDESTVEAMYNSQDKLIREQVASSLEIIGRGDDSAIAALVELIRNSQDEGILQQAVSSLGEIGQGNETEIATLVNLICTSQSKYIRWQAGQSLNKIGQGKENAIADLVELIRTSQSEDILQQAAWSLGKIGQGNEIAIAALVEFISTCQNRIAYKCAVDSLAEISPGNNTAITALIDLIRKEEDEIDLFYGVKRLAKIGKNNPDVVDALVNLIDDRQNKFVLEQVAESLGDIGKDNPIAIGGLLKLIGNFDNESITWKAIKSLQSFDGNNSIVIKALIELIANSQGQRFNHIG